MPSLRPGGLDVEMVRGMSGLLEGVGLRLVYVPALEVEGEGFVHYV